MTARDRLEVRAPAKVNVCLLVGGSAGADGYHPVATVIAPLALSDELSITITAGRGVAVACRDASVPADERNLAAQAASAFVAASEVGVRIELELTKNVPVGAGLGGGSSDAAAVLRALNGYFGEPLAADVLWRLGRRLGSDVPFFLGDGWAFASGRGDVVTPVRGPVGVPLLLAAPRRGVATARVYRALGPADYAGGVDPIWDVLARLEDPPAAWWWAGANSLEGAACRLYPALTELRRLLAELGYGEARLSGSGGAFAAPAVDGARAATAVAQLAARGFWAVRTATA